MKRLPALWSILPDELAKFKHEFHSMMSNGKFDNALKCLKDKDAQLQNIPEKFFMSGNIAIMQIEGVIFPKADFFSFLFGGSTLDVMTRDFNKLINDDSVEAIIFEIDSPGGVVSGVQEFANLVFNGRERKPVFAISSSIMTSAAYWIASATNEVHISDDNVMTGSIGVVIEHIDISELERRIGIKTTEVVAGKYKRIASSVKPLSEEGKEVLQDQVNHVYDAFTSDIARFRGVGINTVLGEMADGKTFIGSQGIDAGLINGFITMDKLVISAEEAARIKAIENQLLPGHEKLIETLKQDNKITGAQAAVKVLQAEKERTAKGLANKPAKTLQQKWDSNANLRAEFLNDFEIFESYVRGTQNGLTKS